jgi:hypothetical protein
MFAERQHYFASSRLFGKAMSGDKRDSSRHPRKDRIGDVGRDTVMVLVMGEQKTVWEAARPVQAAGWEYLDSLSGLFQP